MIGYDRLGTNGRLGNQMFQYASLRGIAANNNLEFCIPPEDTPNYANYGLFDCFKLPNVKNTALIGQLLQGFLLRQEVLTNLVLSLMKSYLITVLTM